MVRFCFPLDFVLAMGNHDHALYVQHVLYVYHRVCSESTVDFGVRSGVCELGATHLALDGSCGLPTGIGKLRDCFSRGFSHMLDRPCFRGIVEGSRLQIC